MQPTVPPQFYTVLAESGKVAFYLILAALIGRGLWQRRRGRPNWANWLHAAFVANFVMGIAYSGVRMITTDPTADMLVRRLFAWEAWFNATSLAFYVLFWWIWTEARALIRRA